VKRKVFQQSFQHASAVNQQQKESQHPSAGVFLCSVRNSGGLEEENEQSNLGLLIRCSSSLGWSETLEIHRDLIFPV
jgi:hypothetical protein